MFFCFWGFVFSKEPLVHPSSTTLFSFCTEDETQSSRRLIDQLIALWCSFLNKVEQIALFVLLCFYSPLLGVRSGTQVSVCPARVLVSAPGLGSLWLTFPGLENEGRANVPDSEFLEGLIVTLGEKKILNRRFKVLYSLFLELSAIAHGLPPLGLTTAICRGS